MAMHRSACKTAASWAGSVYLESTENVGFTNNLFERTSLTFLHSGNLDFYNNLVRTGAVVVYNQYAAAWTLKDNVFLQTTIEEDGSATPSHNAYVGTTSRLTPTNGSEVVLSDFTFAAGPLGNYYQISTNFLDRGSRNATNAGLYHFTASTNNQREASSTVRSRAALRA